MGLASLKTKASQGKAYTTPHHARQRQPFWVGHFVSLTSRKLSMAGTGYSMIMKRNMYRAIQDSMNGPIDIGSNKMRSPVTRPFCCSYGQFNIISVRVNYI